MGKCEKTRDFALFSFKNAHFCGCFRSIPALFIEHNLRVAFQADAPPPPDRPRKIKLFQ
jgi:hypothetical protein